jgi:hypothetical protein
MGSKLQTPFYGASDKSVNKKTAGVYDQHTAPSVNQPGVGGIMPKKFFDKSPSLMGKGKAPLASPMNPEMKGKIKY